MNSETHDILYELAKQAGAIKKCAFCGNYDVRVEGDTESDARAYAMATEAWKRGEFRGDGREEIVAAMKDVLSDADYGCPGGC